MHSDPTPPEFPNIGEPTELLSGIDDLEAVQNEMMFRGMIERLGYTEDQALDYRHEMSGLFVLDERVVILSLTHDRRYRLQTLLEPGELGVADGLLTLRARMRLTPFTSYSTRIAEAFAGVNSRQGYREARVAMNKEYANRHREQMRGILAAEDDAGEQKDA